MAGLAVFYNAGAGTEEAGLCGYFPAAGSGWPVGLNYPTSFWLFRPLLEYGFLLTIKEGG